MDSSIRKAEPEGGLAGLLGRCMVNLRLRSTAREEILRELLRPLSEAGSVEEEETVLQALLERENQASTGVGRGVAIPHVEERAVTMSCLSIGVAKRGVDFGSLDSKPTDLFFLFLFPKGYTGQRMKIVAQVMGLMRKREVREAIRRSADAEGLRETFLRHLGSDRSLLRGTN